METGGSIVSRVFVNFTNHPSDKWEKCQLQAALEYGEIVDVPFPNVDPAGDELYIRVLAQESVEKIMNYEPEVVLCQGEFCLVYQVAARLMHRGVIVLAACSERIVKEKANKKETVFVFRQFRQFDQVIDK